MEIDERRDPSDEQERMIELAQNQTITAELENLWRMVADAERRLRRLERFCGITGDDPNK